MSSKTTGNLKRAASSSPDRDGRVRKLPVSSATDPALLLCSDRPHTAPARWSKFRHIVVLCVSHLRTLPNIQLIMGSLPFSGDSYSSDTKANWVCFHISTSCHD